MAELGLGRARGSRRPRNPSGLRDCLAGDVGGLGRRPLPTRRRHPGGDPRVRRQGARRRGLVQGALRRGLAGRHPARPLRRRPRALRPGGGAGGSLRAPVAHAAIGPPGGDHADQLPDPPRPRRHGGRPRHAGQRPAPARRPGGGRDAGGASLRERRRADAGADRDRRARPRSRSPTSSSSRPRCASRSPSTSSGTGSCRRRCGSRSRSAGGRPRASSSSTPATS